MVLPESIGAELLGESWPAARQVLPPLAIGVAFGSAALGFTSGLRSLAASKTLFRARLFVAALLIAGVFAGALIGRSARGVAWGDAIANALALLVWWWFFLAAMREHEARQKSTVQQGLGVRSEADP